MTAQRSALNGIPAPCGVYSSRSGEKSSMPPAAHRQVRWRFPCTRNGKAVRTRVPVRADAQVVVLVVADLLSNVFGPP